MISAKLVTKSRSSNASSNIWQLSNNELSIKKSNEIKHVQNIAQIQQVNQQDARRDSKTNQNKNKDSEKLKSKI